MRGKYGEKEGGGKPMQKLGHLVSSCFAFVVRNRESFGRIGGVGPLLCTLPFLLYLLLFLQRRFGETEEGNGGWGMLESSLF